MPRMIGSGLSWREREIIDILNRLGSATAAEIESEMNEPPSNSAVRSILRILKEKGHIQLNESGRRYVYTPSVPRLAAGKSALRNVVNIFFDGSINSAVKAFLSDAGPDLSEQELDDLSEMIRRHKDCEGAQIANR